LPTENLPPARRTGGIPLGAGGSAASTAIFASIDRAIPAPSARYALTASLPAESTTQQPSPQPVDVDGHVPIRLLHFRHGMRLQSQLLSDERFDEHLDLLPFSGCKQQPSKD